jgi:hypothetical protein
MVAWMAFGRDGDVEAPAASPAELAARLVEAVRARSASRWLALLPPEDARALQPADREGVQELMVKAAMLESDSAAAPAVHTGERALLRLAAVQRDGPARFEVQVACIRHGDGWYAERSSMVHLLHVLVAANEGRTLEEHRTSVAARALLASAQLWRADHGGALPERLADLVELRPGQRMPRDAWGGEFVLRSLAGGGLEIRSPGPDQQLHTPDDPVARSDATGR